MENVVSSATILWLAFAAAFVFGAIGQKTHFCTMGAVSDIVNMDDWSRMRMWLLAIGIAVGGEVYNLPGGTAIPDAPEALAQEGYPWISELKTGNHLNYAVVARVGDNSLDLLMNNRTWQVSRHWFKDRKSVV